MVIGIGAVKHAKNSVQKKYFYISLAPGLVKFNLNPPIQPNFLLAQPISYYNKKLLAIKTLYFLVRTKLCWSRWKTTDHKFVYDWCFTVTIVHMVSQMRRVTYKGNEAKSKMKISYIHHKILT